MRSRADRVRVERVLRAIALVALVVALVRMLLAASGAGAVTAHATAAGALDPVTRDSLSALARAGERVTWSGSVAPVAATSEPVRDPSARTRISFAGPVGGAASSRATIADSLGAIDSVDASGATSTTGGSLVTAGLAGTVRVGNARTIARLGAAPGRVLVLGRAGWEAKFTIAALEEAGWIVDARLQLVDTLRVTQGRATGAPDLAQHAAVVVLDTAVGAHAAAIVRFVRAGGGLVLSGEGARAPALASLAPGRAGAETAGERDAFERDEPTHALALFPLTALAPDAVVLERRDGAVASAARRIAGGRVIQSGYAETWRWRMQAERDGPAGHRAFWNQLVANAAAGGASARPSTLLDEAPLATIVQRLGPAVADSPSIAPAAPRLPIWLGLLALVLLLAEWASRRARGAA